MEQLEKATGELRRLQLKMLDIVKDIDKLCKENDIQYYIFYGSALGAVRHKGFIPWDDDFDIAMTYDNYQKFIKVAEEKLDKSKYFVQTPGKEKEYYLQFTKIRDISTTLIEDFNKDKNVVRSVFVDVFPLVGAPTSKVGWFFFKLDRAFVLSCDNNIIRNKALYSFFKVILKIFGKEKIIKYFGKKCTKYDVNKSEQVVSFADTWSLEKSTYFKKALGKPTYVEFEDTTLPIPEDYDSILKTIYGNYMQIPSKEERESAEHTRYFLDLDMSYAEYIKNLKK